MKFIKLGLISAVVFGMLFWAITLLFPANTVISRAANIADTSGTLNKRLLSNEISLQTLIAGDSSHLVIKSADIAFYEDNLFNTMSSDALPKADTIFFQISSKGTVVANGGLAFYQLQADSTTTQMFYVFQTPWYKPLVKMKMMVADKVYGPGLDSTLNRLKMMSARY
ncbi:MAG TPA: hypothetical protein VLC98_02235 [Phnomibacter sp.]|nr:hypothetical protein [Phnomibacter sp.]